ncbi:DMT family transporter [Mammaliicoccus sciuri]|uniref:EamA domain-containing membrane protein RarD n=2 Tax=Sporosarcina newyorkensis TaxID=759851 RepID=A0A1T4YZB7_9BACL|nr:MULTISPECIES: DMT family transporter [Sporosarcina]EGQ25572.1 DMT superfamily drug/metabolite transporter [Sporosarcina newyorkensis 2681]MBY0224018.1 DMT family transporter [Sporosarcina aquimarina]SKB07160.1 EamA domain-containing membrane protein RarD [Sporosarcina newyorkensis]
MTNLNKSILLLIASALGFSLMTLFVKLSGDVPTLQKTIFRNGVSMIISFFFVIHFKESLFGKRENQPLLLLRSGLGALGIILLFYAIDHLVLADADMLNKMSPFFTIIFAAIFLKEHVKPFQIYSILVAFLGTLFIIKPSFSLDIVPYAAGILSAIFAGGAYTALRALGRREQFYTIVFYFSTFTTVILLPFVIYAYQPMTMQQTIYLLIGGVFATVGQFGITLAYKYAPAKEVSVFNYFTVVFTALLGFTFLGQVPDFYSIIGYVIIFGASFYMFLKNKGGEEVSADLAKK